MLPWNKLRNQIQNYVKEQKIRNERLEQTRKRMLDLMAAEIHSNWEELKTLAEQSDDSHLIPDFDESPANAHSVPKLQTPVAVAATDGSQIFSSSHEITPLSLINISHIRFDYYAPENLPLLECKASILQREDFVSDPKVKREPSFEELVSDQRTLDEMSQLADISIEPMKLDANKSSPRVALSDGSLILWRLAGRPLEAYEKQIVNRFIEPMERFQRHHIPLAGYISNSNSREVSQFIHFVDRQKQGAGEVGPDITKIPPITDRSIYASLLKESERSIIFHSRSKILQHYGEHSISYFYLHVGSEVARVEIPRWVADNPDYLDRIAGVCLQQADYGAGYPMILSEAHEHAVIRGADRETFYALVEQEMLRQGMVPKPSPKLLRKKSSIL